MFSNYINNSYLSIAIKFSEIYQFLIEKSRKRCNEFIQTIFHEPSQVLFFSDLKKTHEIFDLFTNNVVKSTSNSLICR